MCAQVIEHDRGLWLTICRIKIVSHHEDDVNVIGRRFGRDVAPEDDEAFEFAGASRELVDAGQPSCHELALRRAVTEACQDLVQRRLVNTFR